MGQADGPLLPEIDEWGPLVNELFNMQTLATQSIPRDGEAAPSVMRPRPCMDVSADAQDMQPPRSTATGAGERTVGVAQVAGAVIVSRNGKLRIGTVLAVDFYRGAK
jgi:hypothetical protein